MTKEPLPTTHNVEGRCLCTCREEPKTRPSLEAFEHQQDYLGVQKIIWRANMEKTAQRNIMAIYEDWRIFRKILKRDLALDRMSGRRICPLGHPDGWWPYRWMRSDHRCRPASSSSGAEGGELLVKTTSEAVLRLDLLLRVLVWLAHNRSTPAR